MNKKEHLEWSKKRALEYVDAGNLALAYSSMVSDLNNHEELADHPSIELGMQLIIIDELDTPDKMRKFINDFN